MTKEELVISKLNVLTTLDFYKNYDKSELQRIFTEETEEEKEIKREIEEIMYSLYDRNEYKITINNSFVSIDKIMEKTENGMTLRCENKIWSTNFHKLPLAWVYGRKISKKAMEETLKNLD